MDRRVISKKVYESVKYVDLICIDLIGRYYATVLSKPHITIKDEAREKNSRSL